MARQTEALGVVLTAVDCDAIMSIWAPDSSRTRSTKRALQNVADNFGLCTNTASIGFPNDTQQEIALLYDQNLMSATHKPLGSADADKPRYDGEFWLNIDVDAHPDPIR